MRTKKSTFLTAAAAAIAIAICVCVGVLLGAPKVNATSSDFANLEIAGAQLRLDEITNTDQKEIRFVVEMSADEYAALSNNANNYTLKMIAVKTETLGEGELTYDYTSQTGGGASVTLGASDGVKIGDKYRFYARFKYDTEATQYTARAFILDGSALHHSTEPCVRSASIVASEYIGLSGGVSESDKTKSKEIVLSAYNESVDEDDLKADTFDDMCTKIASMEIELKLDGKSTGNATVLIAGDEKIYLSGGKSVTGKISSGLEELMKVTYTSSDVNVTDNKIDSESITKRGSVSITASACGGLVSCESDGIEVIDENALTIGRKSANGTTYGNVMDFLNGETKLSPDGYGALNWWSSNGSAQYIADNTADTVVNAASERVKAGRVVKFTYNINKNNIKADTFVQSRTDYSKEQVKSLVKLGYTNIVCPVYMEVDSDTLNGDRFNNGARDWLDLYTPNINITGQSTVMGYASNMNVMCQDISHIYANKWTYIRIPLKVVADNYEQFTDLQASAADSYETRRWSWFGISAQNNTLDLSTEFQRSLYFGDFYIEKADRGEDSEGKILIDLSDPAIRAGFKGVSLYPEGNYGGSAGNNWLATGSYNGAWKEEVSSLNADNWLVLANHTLNNPSYHIMNGTNASSGGGFYFDTLGFTKEELENMKTEGKTKFSFDIYFETESGTSTGSLAYKYPTEEAKWNDPAEKSFNFSNNKLTVEIPLQLLIDHFDSFFTAKDNTKVSFFRFYNNNGGQHFFTAFIGNMYIA